MKKLKYGDTRFLSLYIGASIFGASLSAVYLKLSQRALDAGLEGQSHQFKTLGINALSLILIMYVSSRIKSILKEKYYYYSVSNVKTLYAEALLFRTHKKYNAPKHVTHLTNDIDRYEYGVFRVIVECIDIITSLVVSLFVLLFVSPLLALIATLIFTGVYLMASRNARSLRGNEQQKSIALSRYSSTIKESLDAIDVIKQNQIEKRMISKFKKEAKAVQKEQFRIDFKATFIDALNGFVNETIIVLVSVGGIYIGMKQGYSLGTMFMVGMAFTGSLWPMQSLSPLLTKMGSMGIVFQELCDIENITHVSTGKKLDRIERITLDNTVLGYDDTVVLRNLNLDIKFGEKILVYGESGAGKSTLLNALKQQIEPKEGSITVNSMRIDDIDPRSYFQYIAFIDQKGFIFNATVAENISMFRPKMSVDQVMEDVSLETINPKMVLANDGSNLSGGQRTRVMLARALLYDANVIIADEVFANLDDRLASTLEHDLLMLDKTVVIVSHVFFETNRHLYDRIFHVHDGIISEVKN